MLVIWITNYLEHFGPSGKHFLTVIALHLFMPYVFSPNCQINIYIRNYVLMFYLYINKYVAYFQR